MNNKNKDFLGSFDDFFESLSFFKKGFFDQEIGFPKHDDKNFHKTEEVSETETHFIKTEKWVSIDGCQKFERTTRESKSTGSAKLTKEDLEAQLKEAIKSQDFEKACKLRDSIKAMKK